MFPENRSPCLIELVITFSVIMKRIGEKGLICSAPDRRKVFGLSLLNGVSITFFIDALYQLRKFLLFLIYWGLKKLEMDFVFFFNQNTFFLHLLRCSCFFLL